MTNTSLTLSLLALLSTVAAAPAMNTNAKIGGHNTPVSVSCQIRHTDVASYFDISNTSHTVAPKGSHLYWSVKGGGYHGDEMLDAALGQGQTISALTNQPGDRPTGACAAYFTL